jgi:transposase
MVILVWQEQDGITLLGCMAHARRKFEQALDYNEEKASEIMPLIQGLYLVEREARDNNLDAAGRKELS